MEIRRTKSWDLKQSPKTSFKISFTILEKIKHYVLKAKDKLSTSFKKPIDQSFLGSRPWAISCNAPFPRHVIKWNNSGIIFFFYSKTKSYITHIHPKIFHTFISKYNHHKHQMQKLESNLTYLELHNFPNIIHILQ